MMNKTLVNVQQSLAGNHKQSSERAIVLEKPLWVYLRVFISLGLTHLPIYLFYLHF